MKRHAIYINSYRGFARNESRSLAPCYAHKYIPVRAYMVMYISHRVLHRSLYLPPTICPSHTK